MASFIISFRVDNSGDYASRYKSIVEAIEALNTKEASWDETTSFVLIEATGSASDIASSIYLGSEMQDKDKLLVIKIDSRDHATRGTITYPNLLDSFFS